MAKTCELCGRPLGEWPGTKMTGEQRMYLWGTLGLVAGIVASGLTCSGYFDKSNRVDADRAKVEATAKAEQYKACLLKAEDVALCDGKVQTVRCLPTIQKKDVSP